MKRSLLALPLLAAFLISLGCEKKPGEAKPIDVQETYGMILNDFAVLVDVREEAATREGVASQARTLPLSKIRSKDPAWTEFVKSVPSGKQAVFYGAGDEDSREAAAAGARDGLNARSMGAFSGWTKAGLPIRKP
jgi:rhodanese-related sulfurtransferase